MRHFFLFLLVATSSATGHYNTPAGILPATGHGAYPQDFPIIGPPLEVVHESQKPPTGFAVDVNHNIYLTYPRNTGQTPNNIVISTSFLHEQPWPNAAIQNCTAGQDPSTCFINVQNIVRDDLGRLWVVDSGLAPFTGPNVDAVYGGAKIMSFNETTAAHIRTYIIPQKLLAHRTNLNDMRVNTTLGGKGYAFIPDASTNSSLLAINLEDGNTVRRLFNTSVVRADENYVGSYGGEPIYTWNGTRKGHITTAADGIALASGNLYWGVLASRRFYYISQETFVDNTKTDAEILAAVQNPGQCASEQAGFSADDQGRVYIAASEQNAIYYVDTLKSQTNMTVNGHAPGGAGLIPAEDYVVKTLVRNALIQHADSLAIMDGWLYFCTNQLALGPTYQYNNTDRREGPFRSFKMWIGRRPARDS